MDIATQNPELRKNLDTDEGVITGVKLVDLEKPINFYEVQQAKREEPQKVHIR